MTSEEIAQHAQKLIDQLGLSPNVTGLADTQIGYSNYKQVMSQHLQIENDMLVLIRESAKQKGTV